MDDEKNFILLKIRHRPWFHWLIIVFWMAVTIFLLQNCWASFEENESRAGFIFFLLSVLWLLAGLIIFFLGGSDSEKFDPPEPIE